MRKQHKPPLPTTGLGDLGPQPKSYSQAARPAAAKMTAEACMVEVGFGRGSRGSKEQRAKRRGWVWGEERSFVVVIISRPSALPSSQIRIRMRRARGAGQARTNLHACTLKHPWVAFGGFLSISIVCLVPALLQCLHPGPGDRPSTRSKVCQPSSAIHLFTCQKTNQARATTVPSSDWPVGPVDPGIVILPTSSSSSAVRTNSTRRTADG